MEDRIVQPDLRRFAMSIWFFLREIFRSPSVYFHTYLGVFESEPDVRPAESFVPGCIAVGLQPGFDVFSLVF